MESEFYKLISSMHKIHSQIHLKHSRVLTDISIKSNIK